MTSVATSPSASKPCSTIGTLLTRQSLAFFAVVFFVVTTVPHLPDEPLTDATQHPPAAGRRSRRKEARPGELLEAALDLFVEKGFAATRVEDMILASQFKSFLQPLALMTSLPLTLIGVVLALMMFGSALSMFSIIGVVMLMGLVTKNAILLVDFAIRARSEHTNDAGQPVPGLPREEALLLAARVRLRPILMTTLAMIFGMVPLAFALSEGSEQRAPMGQAVIGGVITSSLLTLVVVPVVYCYMDDLARWARRRFGAGASAQH